MPTLGNTPRPGYVYDTEADTWVPIGVGAHTHAYIPNTLVDAKGDILTATANDVPARLGIGANGTVLVSDSTTSTGLAWQPYAAQHTAGKNKIINGDFGIWQRGTSFSGGMGYKADRMFSDVGVSNVISRSTDVPSGQGFTYSYRFVNTEVNCPIRHAIELPATGSLGVYQVGTTWTFSMWAKTSSPRTISLYAAFTIGNMGTPEATPVNAVAMGTTSTSWQRFTYTFTIPAGTSLTSANCFQITPFTTGNGTGVDTFFAGMQLEPGPIATPFTTATGTIQGELAACQRYYWRLTSDTVYQAFGMGFWEPSSSIILTFVDHPVVMRVNPTSIDYAGPFIVYDGTAGTSVNSISIGSFGSRKRSRINLSLASSGTSTRPYELLSNASTTPYLGFNAEL